MSYKHTFGSCLKKAEVKPDNPSPFGDPSSDAVLHADKITILALSFNFSISEIVKIPSFSRVDFSGGVRINPGSEILLIVFATTACVANTIYS